MDALYIFLNIHHCVCEEVTASHLTAIKILNGCLIRICLKRVQDCDSEKTQQAALPIAWRWTSRFLLESVPDVIPLVLPAIVVSHILEDLPVAVYEAEKAMERAGATYPAVQENDFEAVVTHILKCIKKAFTVAPLRGRSFIVFLRKLTQYSGVEYISLKGFRKYAYMVGMQRVEEEFRSHGRKQNGINPPPP